MSTGYGYTCKTCRTGTGPYVVHNQPDRLRALYRYWPEFNRVLDLIRTVGDLWFIDLKLNVDDESDVVQFLNEHRGHDVLLVDEYGKELGL